VIALLQRVTQASVTIDAQLTASIGAGLLGLVGVQKDDGMAEAQKLAEKMLAFRVFSDSAGKMNLDIVQAQGELLLVPQFTLAADTSRGRRPGFSTAASPENATLLFTAFCERVHDCYPHVRRGVFGADMQVALVNDGPVTFWLEV